MATKTTVRRRTTSPVNTKLAKTKAVTVWFKQWLEVGDQAEQLTERKGDLRERILDAVEEIGEPDDKGNVWLELPQVVGFENRKNKVFKYTLLKRERHLLPANPQPIPDLAEALLRKKKLWLTEKQEKAIRDLQLACPYIRISVDVDLDTFAGLVFKDAITDAEYDATLQEQKESFQFRPAES